jgi:peptide/nickel transport system permease protein
VTGYVIRRLIQAIVVTLIVTAVTFVLLHFVPGGEVQAILGIRATRAEIASYNRLLGFDQPVYVQYGRWLWALLHGDLGFDQYANAPVSTLIAEALPKTIVLVALGSAASLLIGVPLGMYQALRRYSVIDHLLTTVSFIGYGAPDFFIGILLVQWFAIDLHWLPGFAPQGTSVGAILSDPVALILPVATFAFGEFGGWSRYMRSSVLDNIVQDYVRTARAKGAGASRVLWGHVFRNSLVTIMTLLGLTLPFLIGGDVFIEVVFNYPGMGLMFFQAALNTDYPLMLAITLITTLLTILGNLLADIGYAALDPRVRYQ